MMKPALNSSDIFDISIANLNDSYALCKEHIELANSIWVSDIQPEIKSKASAWLFSAYISLRSKRLSYNKVEALVFYGKSLGFNVEHDKMDNCLIINWETIRASHKISFDDISK